MFLIFHVINFIFNIENIGMLLQTKAPGSQVVSYLKGLKMLRLNTSGVYLPSVPSERRVYF